MKCPKCGGEEIDHDGARGDAICVNCGQVLEENTIVSEMAFSENPNGSSQLLGQWVSATGSKPFGATTGIPGFSRESREVTIANARKRIQHLANNLDLSDYFVESAQRIFMIAIQHNFTQGRKANCVVAACLYIVCRREKTSHMLIDFSDILQMNVYILGNYYVKLCRLCNFQIPVIDPSLFIRRFAHKLEFQDENGVDKTHAVAMSALRLVQQMNRSWLQTGRRPSGICGACLLIAARVHGFRRTQKEIVRVVRICDMTLRKRLQEFSQTKCGSMTAEEFETMDPEAEDEEALPPAFTKARDLEVKKRKRKAKDGDGEEGSLNGEEEEEDESADPELQGEIENTLKSREFQLIEKELESDRAVRESLEKGERIHAEAEAAEKEKEKEKPPEPADEDLSDIEDDELDKYIRQDPTEIKAKEDLWNEMNREYLLEQEAREKEKEEAIKAGKPWPPKRKKPKTEKKDDALPADSAAEATARMLKAKKISSKINYSVLEGVLGEKNSEKKEQASEDPSRKTSKFSMDRIDEDDDDDDEDDDEDDGNLADEPTSFGILVKQGGMDDY